MITALETAFARAQDLGAARKAVIFTESRRTQAYLLKLLSEAGYAGQIVTLNGVNTEPEPRAIFQRWKKRHAGQDILEGSQAVNMKAALVEEFRDQATLLIATEAAAEGVNLQFCSLVVNYDLPWNPQRIEQRIGRCHRYGQQHDVVVVTFLNRRNEADPRVFELLSEKFRLFDGVFGASDEVLGTLESGLDFEKRIAQVYQECRTPKEIQGAFQALQAELDNQIQARMNQTRTTLLENFDEDVAAKLRVRRERPKKRWTIGKRCSGISPGRSSMVRRPSSRTAHGSKSLRVPSVVTITCSGQKQTSEGPPSIEKIIPWPQAFFRRLWAGCCGLKNCYSISLGQGRR